MNRYAILAISFVALAGCSKPAPTAAVTTAAVPVTAAAPTVSCPAQSGYQWMPANLVLDVPYHLHADRIYKTQKDGLRRRVMLEFLEGDSNSVLAQVDKSLTTAGFQARPRIEASKEADVVIPYDKAGYGNVVVYVDSSPGDNPSNPDAKGILSFDFPIGMPNQIAPLIAGHQ